MILPNATCDIVIKRGPKKTNESKIENVVNSQMANNYDDLDKITTELKQDAGKEVDTDIEIQYADREQIVNDTSHRIEVGNF